MSAGQLVALGGAVVGSFFGMPQLGFLVGSVVGNLLFPNKQKFEGPRLGDRSVTSSAWGNPIMIGFGTVRAGGEVIWAKPIQERRHKEKMGGKGGMLGGSTATQVTYTYYGNFAVSFGEGVAQDILKLWADGKLIYDKTTAGIDKSNPNIRFRFYKGTSTQLQDPLILADKGAETPAYRDQTYIVFQNLPLAKWGNRVPQIQALIAFQRTIDQPGFQLTLNGGSGSYGIASLGVDWDRGTAVIGGNASIYQFNIRSHEQMAVNSWSPSGGTGTIFGYMPDGTVVANETGANRRPILQMDPLSGAKMATFGTSSSSTTNAEAGFLALDHFVPIVLFDLTGPKVFMLTSSVTPFGWWGLLNWDKMGELDTLTLTEDITAAFMYSGAQVSEDSPMLCRGVIEAGFGTGYYVKDSDGDCELWEVKVRAVAQPEDSVFGPVGIDVRKVYDFATGISESNPPVAMWFDESDSSVICAFGTQRLVKLLVDPDDDFVLQWSVSTGTNFPAGLHDAAVDTRLQDGRLGIMFGSGVSKIFDTYTGEIISTQTGWDSAGFSTVNGAQSYHSMSNSIVYLNADGSFVSHVFLERATGEGDQLSHIVESLCARAGLAAEDLDTSALDEDIVRGYIIGRQGTARQAIEPLAVAWFFDAVESDFLLKFVKRGGPSLMTIPEDDMIPLNADSSAAVQETRTQELELPESYDIIYIDAANDYQQGSMHNKRIKEPDPTMYTDNSANIELPIVFEPQEALDIVERALYQNWIGRVQYQSRLPWRYLLLDPADPATLALNDGSLIFIEASKTEFAGDMSFKVEGIASDQASYQPSGAIADNIYNMPQILPTTNLSRVFLPDTNLLRDIDDIDREGSVYYFAMAGYGQPGWQGANLYQKTETGSVGFSSVGTSINEVIYGQTKNALGVPACVNGYDRANTLTVFLADENSTLESVSELDWLKGNNMALVGSTLKGYEVINFQNVVHNSDGSWTLSNLLRGRRGTEYLATDATVHKIGDTFILLEVETMDGIVVPLPVVGTPTQFKAVGFGQAHEEVAAVSRSRTGNDLKPYSPACLKAEVSGVDIVLSWVRRTRVNGQMKDGFGTVDLAEDSEKYEVDILDNTGTTVVRTFTGLTSPTVTYTSAQMVADFGVPPNTLKFVVYQISEQVGRGHPAKTSIQVFDESDDAAFALVTLLMGFEGSDASTTFTDESFAPHTMSAVGNAQIDTAQFVFGGSSALFDGAGDAVSSADNDDWDLGSGPFTIEARVRLASTVSAQGGNCIASQWSTTSNQRGWQFRLGGTGTSRNLEFIYSPDGTSGATVSSNTVGVTVAADTWYTLAVDKESNGDINLYFNGTCVFSANSPGTIHNSTSLLRLGLIDAGAGQTQAMNGWIDEIRITKGAARYGGSNYTPRLTPFPRS